MQTQEVFSLKNYTDNESLKTNVHLSTLFIHISSHRISCSIASDNQKALYSLRILELHSGDIYKNNLTGLKNLFDSFQFDYSDVAATKIIIESVNHAFVPEPLFTAEKAASFLKLSAPVSSDHEILFNRIKKNIVSVFAVEHDFYSALKTLFPQADLLHEAEQLLNIVSEQKDPADTLFVHLNKNYLHIIQFKNNGLHYFNSFMSEADTDIIYFILSVAELLKIPSDKMNVLLFGNVSNNSSLTGLMKKYIPYVELMKRPEQFTYPASFREFQEQQNYLQISSLLCAS